MAARVLRKRGATGSKDIPEKKQKTSAQKQIKEESPDELPHNLGPVHPRQKNAGKIPTPP